METIEVQEIYDRAWRLGVAEPLARSTPLARFLEVVDEEDVTLHLEENGLIEGGPYRGWSVIRVETRDTPLFLAIPPEAVQYLMHHLSEDDYSRLEANSRRGKGK